jgi:hypothetical protein
MLFGHCRGDSRRSAATHSRSDRTSQLAETSLSSQQSSSCRPRRRRCYRCAPRRSGLSPGATDCGRSPPTRRPECPRRGRLLTATLACSCSGLASGVRTASSQRRVRNSRLGSVAPCTTADTSRGPPQVCPTKAQANCGSTDPIRRRCGTYVDTDRRPQRHQPARPMVGPEDQGYRSPARRSANRLRAWAAAGELNRRRNPSPARCLHAGTRPDRYPRSHRRPALRTVARRHS